ncbi:MAG: RluA family pseudouridine synthase [Oscillospiraceae bacterium]|nr:RluA family pseudouridine synthase [Oscillospiraceae bacterium]
MRQYVIKANDADMRADRFLRKAAADIPFSAIQKAFRTKNVKRNGKRCPADVRLTAGDELRLYVNEPQPESPAYLLYRNAPMPIVVYEDDNILVLHKPPGLLSQSNIPLDNSLESSMRTYLLDRGKWNPAEENVFTPSLCHRLDRGTEGLVLAAKTAPALRILTEKIALREIRKTYRAVVFGTPSPNRGIWRDFLYKDARQSLVTVCKGLTKGARTAELEYNTIETRHGLCLLECYLITGRTHQIRVQCAHHGHPILGDGKYGRDNHSGKRHQALCATSLLFNFRTSADFLEYLKGKKFEINKGFDDLC